MDDIMFHVRPAGHGWLVDAAAGVQPLLFHSGAKAVGATARAVIPGDGKDADEKSED